MNKHFLNEKGITLVELLAALSLFAVVSALVMTVLFNVFLNSKNISDNAQLRQDANLLVSTLRSHYNQGDFKVGLNDSNSLLIDGQEVNSSMTSSIYELIINDENLIEKKLNESVDVKADGTPLSIDLTLENEAGQTYRISTTIEKPAELAIALPPVPPDKPEPNKINFTEVEPPVCRNIKGNTKYVSGGSYQLIDHDCKKDNITITGHVWLSGKPHEFVEMKNGTAEFNVTENLFVDTIFNIDNRHRMSVQGDAVFDSKLELKNEGKLSVDNNIFAHDVVVDKNTTLETGHSMVVDGDFNILSQARAVIVKNLFVSNKLLAKDSSQLKLNIGENLIIDGNLEMSGYKPQITVDGSASISNKLLAKDSSVLNIGENLIINGILELYDNAEITVEGNARINGNLILRGNSNLTITGDLTVTGDVIQDDNGYNGTIKVEGTPNFSKEIPSWLNFED